MPRRPMPVASTALAGALRRPRCHGMALLLIGLFLPLTIPATGLHTSGDLSICLLTFTPPVKEGASLASPLRQLLEGSLASGPAPTLSELLLAKGATWSILETPTTLQLGLFLPLPAAEAAELAAVFCQYLVIRFQTATWRAPAPNWVDQLKDFCLQRWPSPRTPPFLTLYVNPPLTPYRDRLASILKGIIDPVEPTSPQDAPLSHEKVCPSSPPRVTHLAAWLPASLEAITAARFLGERFLRLPGGQGHHSYDIWTFPQAVVLALSATAPLERLWERDAFTADFLALNDDPASSPAWIGFADHFTRIHRAERGELEKGAFLEAWRHHLGLTDQKTDRPVFRRPDQRERVICLPRPLLHRLVARLDSHPRYAAVRSPTALPSAEKSKPDQRHQEGTSASSDLTQDIDVVVAIRGSGPALDTLARSIAQAPVPELAGSTFQPASHGIWFWRWSVPRASLTYSLSAARALVEAVFGLSAPDRAGSATPPAPVGPPIEVAVVAASPLPPYELFGLLQQGWPPPTQFSEAGLASGISPATPPPAQPRSVARSLDQATLRTLLGLPTASPAALQGRWTIQTATGSGLARIVASLLLLNIAPESIESVDSLF